MYRFLFKRLIDILIALPSIIVLSPIILITAIVIKLQDGGPAIFKQARVGLKGEDFTLLKFRSMPVNTANVASSETHKLTITPFGKFIRRSNIDELPQLFNILRGDMSIVGPRPALASQEQLVNLRLENGAYDCKPGLTGLAQINSYDNMPVNVKAEWDIKYAQRITFGADLKIIFSTFGYLLKPPPTY
ncbi:sugar transferase [Marinifilum flexuosum]|uniref:O-antigen biosynthesis protein WbqP n=1 Tax=Marinifilum flexuosum TaxID=1117708 RepID=A0A419XA42_9BACT|nr:sugar transferase [Marinifilum flexuosum]RKE04611.1 O-antigen biosynthesis protein WbqP [Marinifilum flexuosum]